jgi:uncharacterized protein
MVCRENCGACCIVPSISSAIPGMPKGKPAGVRCIHLTDELTCGIYDSPDRPKVCDGFQADPLVCGISREEAIKIFAELEGLSTISELYSQAGSSR